MEITFKNVVEWILKGISFILVVSILFGIGAFVYNKYFTEPVYSASIKFFASELESNVSIQKTVASQFKEFLNVNEFYEMVAEDLEETAGLKIPPKSVGSYLTFSSLVEDTTSFSVTVKANDPQKAFDIACSVAKMAPKRVESFADAGKLQVFDNPTLPTSPSSVSPLRSSLAGLILGFVIASALVVLKEVLDNRIKTPDEITSLFGIPVLGIVPDFSSADTKGGK